MASPSPCPSPSPSTSLLPRSHSTRGTARLRRAIVLTLATRRLGPPPPPRPSLALAKAHVRWLLPKASPSSPLLLSLCAREADFSAHVGVGVATYMQFVRRTAAMFAIASLLALPQFGANAAGGGLGLALPWEAEGRCAEAYAEAAAKGLLTQILAHVTGLLGWLLYATMLGNADLGGKPAAWPNERALASAGGPTDAPHARLWAARATGGGWVGAAHLWSELVLASFFCVYTLYIFRRHRRALAKIESATARRASDFAVHVSGLPEAGVAPAAIRAHFRFFGEVASVAISRDSRRLVGMLLRMRRLRGEWRYLHDEYARAEAVLRPAAHGRAPANLLRMMGVAAARQQQRDLLGRMEVTLRELLECGERLRVMAAAPSPCTGHAFVIFRHAAAAAKCARHFDAIRRHSSERGLGGIGVDFRMMYWNDTYKLEVCRAPEPSDIIWESLPTSPAVAFGRRLRTTLVLFLVSCVSTTLIVLANQFATLHSVGVLTTLWTTPLIIVSNVVIFALTPALSIGFDSHHHRSSQHVHMLLKMVFFQCFNTIISCSSFFYVRWPAPAEGDLGHCPLPAIAPLPPGTSCAPGTGWSIGKPSLTCVRHWYFSGSIALLNALVGDLFAILLLIEFVMHGGPDKIFARHVIARRARTQAEMNQAYAIDADMYLPFRYNLVLKVTLLAIAFCPAIPLLLPFACFFLALSYAIDRYNLLRVLKPPPQTSDRAVTTAVLYILPIACCAHVFYALFFFSKQAGADPASLYYLSIAGCGALILFRISIALRANVDYNPEPLVEDAAPATSAAGVGRRAGGLLSRHHLPRVIARSRRQRHARLVRTDGAEVGDPDASGCERGDGAMQLYLPPLTSTLLGTAWLDHQGHVHEGGSSMVADFVPMQEQRACPETPQPARATTPATMAVADESPAELRICIGTPRRALTTTASAAPSSSHISPHARASTSAGSRLQTPRTPPTFFGGENTESGTTETSRHDAR